MRFDLLVPALVMFALLAIGLELTAADFGAVRRRGALLAAGLLLPVIVLPLVALLLAVFRPPVVIGAGVLLIAACPIGGISNTYAAARSRRGTSRWPRPSR